MMENTHNGNNINSFYPILINLILSFSVKTVFNYFSKPKGFQYCLFPKPNDKHNVVFLFFLMFTVSRLSSALTFNMLRQWEGRMKYQG